MKLPSKEFFGQMLLSMFGGGILGPIGVGYLMNYGGNNGCFAWADALYGVPGYESCMQLGLHGGVILGSIIGFLVWKYSSMVRNGIMRTRLSIVILGYFLGGIALLCALISGLPFRFSFEVFSDPDFYFIFGASVTVFAFASVLSIIPFLIYKGIQHLAIKK
jgi:hypothetical protein